MFAPVIITQLFLVDHPQNAHKPIVQSVIMHMQFSTLIIIIIIIRPLARKWLKVV